MTGQALATEKDQVIARLVRCVERVVGEAIRAASDRKVALLASDSLSHRIWPNKLVEAGTHQISHRFNELVDKMVLDLWRRGEFATFIEMLADYARHCSGEGHMHDTAMLLSALGWDGYTGHAEIITDWFASSGTGQVNVFFPL